MSDLQVENAGIEMDERWLVRGVNLCLTAGKLTALVGPNGSGKTTLLRILAGLWKPNEGKVLLDGRDLREIDRREIARRIAFTPQDTHLSFAFTVRDTVAQGRHAHLGRFEREGERDRRAVAAAMRQAEVAHLAKRLVTELSGGERQRVLIARSLATEADIILLDEPTASLDVAHALGIFDLCNCLVLDGKTIVMAIHDLNAVARCASQVALMSGGRLLAHGNSFEVLTDAAIRNVFGVYSEQVIGSSGKPMFFFQRLIG